MSSYNQVGWNNLKTPTKLYRNLRSFQCGRVTLIQRDWFRRKVEVGLYTSIAAESFLPLEFAAQSQGKIVVVAYNLLLGWSIVVVHIAAAVAVCMVAVAGRSFDSAWVTAVGSLQCFREIGCFRPSWATEQVPARHRDWAQVLRNPV